MPSTSAPSAALMAATGLPRVHRDQLPVENPFHEERVHDQHHAEHRAFEIERGVRMVVPAIRAARVFMIVVVMMMLVRLAAEKR
jgi:hypothetical protein